MSKFLVLILLFSAPALASDLDNVWSDPDQQGHGLVIQELGNGQHKVYWYAHCPELGEEPEQCWFESGEKWMDGDTRSYQMHRPHSYGLPVGPSVTLGPPDTTLAIELTQDGLIVEWEIQIPEVRCSALPGPRPPQCEDGGVAYRAIQHSGSAVMQPHINR